MANILTNLDPITLDAATSIRMLEYRIKNDPGIELIYFLFPTERSLANGLRTEDLITEFGRHDLNGKRLVTFGDFGKILEVQRANGKIMHSVEMGYDVFSKTYQDFSGLLESELQTAAYLYPGVFLDKNVVVAPELFISLMKAAYTSAQYPQLRPKVIIHPDTAKHFSEKYLAKLPWQREDYNGTYEFTEIPGGLKYRELGERGSLEATFEAPTKLELAQKYLTHFFK